jgi:hypothetical protein
MGLGGVDKILVVQLSVCQFWHLLSYVVTHTSWSALVTTILRWHILVEISIHAYIDMHTSTLH